MTDLREVAPHRSRPKPSGCGRLYAEGVVVVERGDPAGSADAHASAYDVDGLIAVHGLGGGPQTGDERVGVDEYHFTGDATIMGGRHDCADIAGVGPTHHDHRFRRPEVHLEKVASQVRPIPQQKIRDRLDRVA